MSKESVTFSNGSLRFSGTLYRSRGHKPSPTIIVAHSALAPTRGAVFYRHLIRRLPAAGIDVFIYDRRGSGESEGDFATADFLDLASDVVAALDFLKQCSDVDEDRIGVYGISQGGWIAPIVASLRHDVRCVVVVSGCAVTPAEQMRSVTRRDMIRAGLANSDIEHALTLYDHLNDYYRGGRSYDAIVSEINEARKEPWIAFVIDDFSGLPEDPTRDKWYYEMDFDPLPYWRRVQQPTLFLFGNRDRWVSVDENIPIFAQETRHLPDVTIKQFAGVNHFMGIGDNEDSSSVSRAYLRELLDWLRIHLGKV